MWSHCDKQSVDICCCFVTVCVVCVIEDEDFSKIFEQTAAMSISVSQSLKV